jgi:hypothetical protein
VVVVARTVVVVGRTVVVVVGALVVVVARTVVVVGRTVVVVVGALVVVVAPTLAGVAFAAVVVTAAAVVVTAAAVVVTAAPVVGLLPTVVAAGLATGPGAPLPAIPMTRSPITVPRGMVATLGADSETIDVASPNANTLSSLAASQYPFPSTVGAIPTMGTLSPAVAIDPK